MSDDHTRDDEDETGGADDAVEGDSAQDSPARPPATVLGTILAGALEQLQEGLGGAGGQSGDDAGKRLQLMAGRVLENMSRARRERDIARAAEALARAEIEDGEDGDDGEVIDLAEAREAREARQSARPPVDLKAVVNQAVASYVREHEEASGGEEKVTIDGDFVARHGSELVRAVVTRVGQAWLGALTGTPGDEAAPSDDAGAPKVDYDVLSILGGLLRPPAEQAASDDASNDDDDDVDR